MYGRGSIRVLEGMVEQRMRPLLAQGLQEEWLALLCIKHLGIAIVARSRIKHGDWFYVGIKRSQQLVDFTILQII